MEPGLLAPPVLLLYIHSNGVSEVICNNPQNELLLSVHSSHLSSQDLESHQGAGQSSWDGQRDHGCKREENKGCAGPSLRWGSRLAAVWAQNILAQLCRLPTEHQSWRLTGGIDSCEGQVEVYFRGVWSTVCDSEWYSSEAKVLCRALGCGSEVDRPRGLPHSLKGRMYYSCKGEEPTLSSCSWRFNNSYLCSQSLAARVVCSGNPSPVPPPLDLIYKNCLCLCLQMA